MLIILKRRANISDEIRELKDGEVRHSHKIRMINPANQNYVIPSIDHLKTESAREVRMENAFSQSTYSFTRSDGKNINFLWEKYKITSSNYRTIRKQQLLLGTLLRNCSLFAKLVIRCFPFAVCHRKIIQWWSHSILELYSRRYHALSKKKLLTLWQYFRRHQFDEPNQGKFAFL